ncbi:hypothetical protein C8Q70DRAFT_1052215 [Cubamyces menziesii]|nr:hypothetical protein C8Q70DRAFT_1052215 [Cubamyces menziesii]
MAPVPESLAYANATGNTKSFITPAAVFAFLFEVLLVILIVLSIFAIVRRYTMNRRPQTAAQTFPPLSADAEAQQGPSPSFVKTRGWRSWDASRMRAAVAAFQYHRGPLDDTAALLEKGSEAALSPLFPTSTRAESSQLGASHSDSSRGRLHSISPPTIQSEQASTSTHSCISHFRTCATPNYCSTSDSRASTRLPPHAHVEDQRPQNYAPSSSGLSRRSPVVNVMPSIVVTACNDEFEVSSPASTYSEPDSPTVSTPPPEFSPDVHVFDGLQGTLRSPPWTWALSDGDASHVVEPDILAEGASHPAEYKFGGEASCIAPHHSASRSARYEDQGIRPLRQDLTIVEDDVPASTLVIIAAPELDMTPIREFWVNGPALVTQCWAEGDADLPSCSSGEDEEEWETAWRTGGRLVRAFASSCSTDTLSGSEQDLDENMEYFVKLYNVKAECFVPKPETCSSKFDIISPPCEVPVEWCGRPESADSSSSWQSSYAGRPRRISGSDSGSSFYSCSRSSFTEDSEASDSFSDKDNYSSRLFNIAVAMYGRPPSTICTT